MTNTLTAAAATFRNALKASGIKARVRVCNASGYDFLQVIVPTYTSRFSAEEIAIFCRFAVQSGMTLVQGLPIIPENEAQLTGALQWEFYA